MVPVVLITGPGKASAAVSTTVASATINVGGSIGNQFAGADCNATGYWLQEGGNQVRVNLNCSTGWNARDPKLAVEPSGTGCSVPTGQAFVTPDGEYSQTFVVNGSSCTVEQLCWEYFTSYDTNPFTVDDTSGCVAFPLGSSAETPTACDAGSVARPSLDDAPVGANGRLYKKLNIQINPSDSESPGSWYYYTVHSATLGQGGSTSAGTDGFSDMGTSALRLFPAGAYPPGAFVARYHTAYPVSSYGFSRDVQVASRTDRTYVWQFPVIGVGVVYQPRVTQETGYSTGSVSLGLGYLPQEQTVGFPLLAGTTNPALCTFYWGQKIADVSNVDWDDPISGLGSPANPDGTVPPPPAAAGCDFSFSDPSTWAGGGICALVALMAQVLDALSWLSFLGDILGVLGDVLSALIGLVADLAEAIGDLLRTLFIPSPDSWNLDGLVNQWENRGPGQLAGEVGEGVGGVADGFSGGGGCGSLADFSNDDISANVTCSQVRDSPGMAGLYLLVQAGLIALTCWGIWHMVVGSIKNAGAS